jgi:hypothetical protein
MKIKAILSHFTPSRIAIIINSKKQTKKKTSIGENVKELKTVNIDNRNINWYSYCGKQFDHSSKA